MTPTDKIIDALRAAGREPQEQGTGYEARCPAHEDETASLSVSTGRDGRALINCHAGCHPKDVMQRLGLQMTDLFMPGSKPDRPPLRRSRIVETYDYTDEHGGGLFQAVRLEPKDFRQRHYNPSHPKAGRDGWVWSLKGCRRVLYSLPLIARAIEARDVVIVVEGEKDVHALEALGLTATTCPMGAGKWRPEYSESLRGARVVIVPDNDRAGRKHAEDVAQSLQGIASEVKVLHLPGLSEKGDVSDWLARGGTRDELIELTENATPYVQPGGIDDTSRPLKHDPDRQPIGRIVADVERERLRWLWYPRLALGKLTILDGDPGLGKSTLYCDIAARMTTGRGWPDDEDEGRAADPQQAGGVVIVTVEDGLGDTIRPRLEEAGADLSRVCVVQTVPEYNEELERTLDRVPTVPEDLPKLARAAKRVGARLLVIDPLFAHLGLGTKSHNDQHVRSALSPLAYFAETHNLAVLVVRHLNKMPGGNVLYRGGGSIGIIGQARLGLLLGAHPEEDGALVLAQTKANIAKHPQSLALRVVSSPNDSDVGIVQWEGGSTLSAQDLVSRPSSTSSPARDEAKAWLRDELAGGDPHLAREMWKRAEVAGHSKNTIRRAQKDLGVEVEQMPPGPRGSWYWTLPLGTAKTETISPDAPDTQAQARGYLGSSKASLPDQNMRIQPISGDSTRYPSPTHQIPRHGADNGGGYLANGLERQAPAMHLPPFESGCRVTLEDGREGTVTPQRRGHLVGVYLGIGDTAETVYADPATFQATFQ